MSQQALLVATLNTPSCSSGTPLATLPDAVQWVEVRADMAGDLDPIRLRRHFCGPLLYTLRSQAEGGMGGGVADNRRARLLRAAQQYDLIDLEGERDLIPELLAAIPPHRRVISWHGPATDANGLCDRLARLSTVSARLYRLVPQAETPGDALTPLAFLHRVGRADTTAYAAGPAGLWSRVVAPHLGAPVVFGSVASLPETGDMPTVTQLVEDYGFPELPAPESLYGIVGDPVLHSLSPRLHNAAYRTLGLSALYLPFQVTDFADFWHTVAEGNTLPSIGLALRGLTVASPHKEAALEVADMRSPIVQRAGSSNVFVRHNGAWLADTTDAEGILLALQDSGIQVDRQRVAVIGCGGSGRAAAAALDQAGADVTLINRSRARGELAVDLLGLPFVPLAEFTAEDFAIVVHATPVGRDDDRLPFALDGLRADAAVVDLVYGAEPTPLMTATRRAGRIAIDGRDILITQVRGQFRHMTGQEMPRELAYEMLGREAHMTAAALVES
ncbi:type I 3-dehydroquinate dehydratase [Candidatus Entotheonella palauensis]|uniref:Shikimate dehydrogenase substrate binding N-terminal domain-containing protein n=1 Tax=Candidatus Entotheonella gemina TaxID=1429439 RepID=W4M2H1_9BACT|nr:type I 3-dehydroquinate dehydratase [Candidatus Entotheonella palauensis]ETX03817.1 MAG: hypothetical protein ETSY2_32395 [Candidatus Entotheonella gemina]